MHILNAISLALPLIYDLEGCKLAAYLDTLARPPVWTIGHGTTHAGGRPVCEGMTCTRAQADDWAIDDLADMASAILSHIRVDVSDQQFAACLSLAYNIGVTAFERSSVLGALNQRLYFRAADRFLLYDHAGGVRVRGLTVRRERERALFLGGTEPVSVIPRTAAPETDAERLNEAELARERAETARLNKQT